LAGGRYAVESYLEYHGERLVRRFDANTYIVLSEAMNHHDVGRGRGGIAEALALAEHFADGDNICVILGDNIIEGSIREAVDAFAEQRHGARILLKEVPDAERFGVAEIEGDRIAGIEEKPASPKSNYAVTGIDMYDATVFEKIRTLVPSQRGELEITDVNNAYIRENSMTFSYLEGWWTDAGTFDSLLRAGNLVARTRRTQTEMAQVVETAGQ